MSYRYCVDGENVDQAENNSVIACVIILHGVS